MPVKVNLYRLRLFWWYGCLAAYIAFFGFYAAQAWKYPMKNWDMIPYMAAAMSFSDRDRQHVYDATIAEAKKVYHEQYYNRQVENKLLKNSDVFSAQLPFYYIKPLYNSLVWLLHKTGMSWPEATYVPSIAGFCLIAFLCFKRRPAGLDATIWWILVMLMALPGYWPLVLIAGLSTPDVLSIALFLCGFLAWIYRHNGFWFGFFMILAQLARPDMALLTIMLALYFNKSRSADANLDGRGATLLILISLALYYGVGKLAGDYGWQVLFYYKFIDRLPYPGQASVHFGLSDYWWILRYSGWEMLKDHTVQAVGALSLVSFTWHWLLRGQKEFFSRLLLLLWLALVIRFAIFPAPQENRYYFAYYLGMLYASGELLAPCLADLVQRVKKRRK